MRKTFEELLDGRQVRRMKAEDRHLAKLEKQEKAANRMIGELCREGKTVYYIHPLGGRYKESDSCFDLFEYLVRNRYV